MVRILEVPSNPVDTPGRAQEHEHQLRVLSPGVSSERNRAFCMPQLSRSPVSEVGIDQLHIVGDMALLFLHVGQDGALRGLQPQAEVEGVLVGDGGQGGEG